MAEESVKKATKRKGARAADNKRAAAQVARAAGANPRWFVPVMCGLMIVGLIWVVTYYLTEQRYPVASWGNWNLAAGFAFIIAGFLMTTRWR